MIHFVPSALRDEPCQISMTYVYLININFPEPDPLLPSLSYFRFSYCNLGLVDKGLTNEDRDEERHSVTQPFLSSLPPGPAPILPFEAAVDITACSHCISWKMETD